MANHGLLTEIKLLHHNFVILDAAALSIHNVFTRFSNNRPIPCGFTTSVPFYPFPFSAPISVDTYPDNTG